MKDIATRKCEKVSADHQKDLVIAADTVVVIDNEIIGKPKDEKDAYRMLKKLSNKTHFVYTGYAISKDNKMITGLVKTEVTFKAGAYGYQDNKDFALVKKINGSYHNVIGFPTEEIDEDIKRNFSL